jgi:DNA repair protein RadD
MSVELYKYQEEAIDKLRQELIKYKSVIGVAYCGAGKTIIISKILSELKNNKNSLLLVHRSSLLNQLRKSLKMFNLNHIRIDRKNIERLSNDKKFKKEFNNHNIYISLYLTCKNYLDSIPKIDLLVIDECHLSANNTYTKIVEYLKDINPSLKIIGVTATPIRTDSRSLHNIYNKIIPMVSIKTLVDEKRIIEPTLIAGTNSIRSSELRVKAGDYDKKQNAVAVYKIFGDIIKSYKTYIDNKTCIVFCPTVDVCIGVAKLFTDSGYSANYISSKCPKSKLPKLIKDMKNESLKVITSVNVLNEGVDIPNLQSIMMLRATKSQVINAQQIGRGVRPSPGKDSFFILDLCENYTRHDNIFGENEIEWYLIKKAKNVKTLKTDFYWCCEYEKVVEVKCNTLNKIHLSHCQTCNEPKPLKYVELVQSNSTYLELYPESCKFVKELRSHQREMKLSMEFVIDQTQKELKLTYHKALLLIRYVCGFKKGWVYFRLLNRDKMLLNSKDLSFKRSDE